MRRYGTPIPDGVTVVLYVDFLDESKRVHSAPKYSYEKGTRFTGGMLRLRGVEEVIDGHQCWLKYHVQGRFFEDANDELQVLRGKVARLTDRYSK